MRYVVITGGVLSGIGKGTIASSLCHLLSNSGVKTSAMKIDPYLNYDAGTMNPYQHGEVFVLDDGSESDLDLGNYERYLDRNLNIHKKPPSKSDVYTYKNVSIIIRISCFYR